jgi:CheY-like chemotaxis protein
MKPESSHGEHRPSRAGSETATPRLIYLVDDDVEVAELAAGHLRGVGYRTRVFGSPAEALSALAAQRPEPALLVADFSMREMDGLDLMRRCRHLCAALKVIVMTGTVPAEMLRESGVAPDAVLEKPVAARKLVAAVGALVGAAPQAASRCAG